MFHLAAAHLRVHENPHLHAFAWLHTAPSSSLPAVCCRQQSGFVGLKNGGATCYMNAVFQQLFMQPSIRALVLGAAEVPPADRKDSVFFQLQVCQTSAQFSHTCFVLACVAGFLKFTVSTPS